MLLKFIPIFIIIVLILIAEKCLQLIVFPVHHDTEFLRKQTIEEGFADALNAYDNEWDRKDFSIENDGATIYGEIIRNPDAKENRVAIICHGHTANRISAIKYGDIFYRRGYNVVIYDERSFGVSTGGFCTLGEKESKDLEKIIAYVREEFSPDCYIALHGESMGAATALLVLRYTDVNLVVADCPFADSERLFNEYIRKNMSIPPIFIIPILKVLALLQYNYHIKQTSPIEAVKNTNVPICFMHGEDDGLIVCDHSKVMIEVCKNPLSRLNLFPKADHAMSIVTDRKRYEELIDEFLNDCYKQA
ncbi:MAG: alpha/beta hydrolase [Erysipelotrichaceae bacterium]|nr:alpha/beta hydrolase [Erysipelotrichaceae bacterium]